MQLNNQIIGNLQSYRIIFFLKFLTISVFLGRAWQHIFLDIPLRELLWREEWMSQPVKAILGMEWEDFISSMVIDEWIVRLTVFAGIFYLLCALASFFLNVNRKWLSRIIIVGSISLVLLSLLYWLEKFQSIGQFIEYSLQISARN